MLRLCANAQGGWPYHLIAMTSHDSAAQHCPLCFPGSVICLLSEVLAFILLLLHLTSPSPKRSKSSRECFCNLPLSLLTRLAHCIFFWTLMQESSLIRSSQSICFCGCHVSTTDRCIIVHLQRLFLGTCTMLANCLLYKHKDVTWIRSLVPVGKARHVVWVCSSRAGAREWGFKCGGDDRQISYVCWLAIPSNHELCVQ